MDPDNRYKTTFETWNKIAALYQEKFMDLDLYNATYAAFAGHLPMANSKILEIGCGPGMITKYLLSHRPNFEIEGIDISPNMIELSRKNNPTALFTVMDSRDIDQLKTKYNGIVCGFCLPYLSEADCLKLIKDCGDLLTTNGILYLSYVEGKYEDSGYLSGSTGYRTFFYYHNLKTLEKILLKNNFIQLDLTTIDFKKNDGSEELHSILISKKRQ